MNMQVYFHGGLWGGYGDEQPGKALPLDREFFWGQERWLVPAVYLCEEGIVLDLCAEVQPTAIEAFLRKWNFTDAAAEETLTAAERTQALAENPLNLDILPVLITNGVQMPRKSASSVGYMPVPPEGVRESKTARRLMEHYGLEPQMGWRLHRISFPWPEQGRMDVDSLQLLIEQEPVELPGPCFTAQAGEQVGFTHPITGTQHCLSILDLRRDELDQSRFGGDETEYPNHFILMEYSLQPPLDRERFAILDCEESDPPKLQGGVIGGAASVGVLVNSKEQAACSSLHYAPQEQVTWRMVFREKLRDDLTVTLL